MWILAICVLNFVLVVPSNCATKSFTSDIDIYSYNHWVGGKPQKTCEGLVFPAVASSLVQLGKLEVGNIVLPSLNGDFYLAEDFEVVFDENTKSPMNCVELRDLHAHEWSTPSSWEIPNKKGNVAIPHMERAPCEFDDVVLPHGIRSGTVVHLTGAQVKMRSFRFGDEKWTNEDLSFYSKSRVMEEVFLTFGLEDAFDITNKNCEDPGGCVCGNEEINSAGGCQDVPRVLSFSCLNPVRPIGFCHMMCGASILAEPNYKFRISEMEETIREYNSDTYVSKVKNSTGQELIQIIFAEKEFTGDSLEEANSLHQKISTDPRFHLERVQLYASGAYYKEGAAGKNAAGIIFGTLIGVGLVFVTIFLIYSPEGPAATLRNRLNFGSRPISDLTTRFFARYDSVGEDAGLIFEGRSMAGSVVSLERAFENPLYGKEKESTPSTSSNSDETFQNVTLDEGSRSDIGADNHLFVIKENVEEIDETVLAEEGELVNLTDVN